VTELVEEDLSILLKAILPVCDQFGLVLAGGYAVKAHGLVTRPSNDLDLATASSTPMEEIVSTIAKAYAAAGLAAKVIGTDGRKGHLIVELPGGGAYRVDILKEPLTKPAVTTSLGPTLSLVDAVGLKVGALHDRGLPRDLIDVYAATQYFSNTELAVLGRQKLQEDFNLEDLRDQLDHAYIYPEEEFVHYGIDADQIAAIKLWAQQWADELAGEIAESFN
jgi:hypothetical protein